MKNIHLKKAALATLLLSILVLGLTACGSAVPDRLTGTWSCDDFSSGNKIDTSYYSITISKDGSFTLDNAKSGKADMSGTMKGDDTGKLGILELDCSGSFNPPECWKNLQHNSRLRYKIVDEDTIRLGYVGIWMTFTK